MSDNPLLILVTSLPNGDDDCYVPHPLIRYSESPKREDDCFAPGDPFQFYTIRSDEDDNTVDCAPHSGQTPAGGFINYNQVSDSFLAPLSQDFHLVLSPFVPSGPVALNQAAWERWQNFISPRPLTEKLDHELARQQLIQPTGSRLAWEQSESQTLTAWLHVTNACDLDCPYCYVRKSSARMSEETGKKAIGAVFATAVRHHFPQVKLKYAGGEATLHFNMIRNLHRLAQQKSEETGVGLTAVVLSNGVNLRPEDAVWLKENQVRLMISLDGVDELHDRLRPNKSGDGTFSRVAHTIDQVLLPLGIRPYITMTVTRINAFGAADLAQWAIVERQLPVNFNLYRQNLLSTSRQDLALEENVIINGLKAAYAVIEQALPEEPILGGLLDRVQAAAHTHTCGVGQNYVVITHTGKLAECHMRLEESTPLTNDLLAASRRETIHNLAVDEKEGCRECTFRYRCSGGCPLETYRATGRWDVKSPHCRIYKTLLPEVLRLHGLQALKANGHLVSERLAKERLQTVA